MSILLKFSEVAVRLNCTRQTVYKLVSTDPTFPRPIRLTPKCPRFRADEIEAWLADRQAEPVQKPEPIAA